MPSVLNVEVDVSAMVTNVQALPQTVPAKVVATGHGWTVSAIRIVKLNQGDVVDIRFVAYGATDAIRTASLQISKISN